MVKSKFPPLLHLTYLLQQSSDELLQNEVGVSLSHARIMSGLDAHSARTQRRLALELRQTEANISRQLQAMKKLGLVTISKNKKDARARDVKLTAKGASKYQQAENRLQKEQSNLVKLVDFDVQRVLADL